MHFNYDSFQYGMFSILHAYQIKDRLPKFNVELIIVNGVPSSMLQVYQVKILCKVMGTLTISLHEGSRFPYTFLFVQEIRCLLWLPCHNVRA